MGTLFGLKSDSGAWLKVTCVNISSDYLVSCRTGAGESGGAE